MTLEEYLEMTGFSYQQFAKMLGIGINSLYKYRKHNRHPNFDIVMRIVNFTNGKISYAELGWTEKGEKIKGWTKSVVNNNLTTDGMQNNDSLSANSLDSSKEKRELLLQSEGQGKEERHCVG